MGIGIWWLDAARQPAPAPAASRPVPASPPAQAVAKTEVDPALVGTFERRGVVDDYDGRFIASFAADGTCHSVTTHEEFGTFRAANGSYRTVGSKTGRVRTGTYRAAGVAAIEVTSATGTAVFGPTQPAGPVDQAHPVMLGIWRATVVQSGLTWTVTVQNNPDGTYHTLARTEDSGSCAFADQNWRTTSAVTGQSKTGTYRLVGAGAVEITGPDGPAMWQRQ